METYNWYSTLIKPAWAPPAALFGPVWSVLYAIIILSFGYVAYRYMKGMLPLLVVLPFVFNIVFNLAFTPIQFGLQNNLLASIDILLVWGTIVWAGIAIYPYLPWVVYVNIPYFLF